MVAESSYCLHLPKRYSDIDAAPLLCAGLIGYRALVMAGDAKRLGIYVSAQLVPAALKAVAKGGIVVCGGIHMSDIPSFPYAFLWGERRVVSVANLTREDGRAFMRLADEFPLEVSTTAYSLTEANQALTNLRGGRVHGAAVLKVLH